MEFNRPSVSRDTRVLLSIILISLATLWVLARIRFPDRPATPNPVPPVLAQLAPPPALEDIAAAVALLEPRVAASIAAIELSPRAAGGPDLATPRHAPALRFRDDLAVALLNDETEFGFGGDAAEISRDRASGLVVIRVPGAAAAMPSPWVPRRVEQPRFLIATDASLEGTSLRPVFVGSLRAIMSPVWSGSIWALPPSADLAPGTFVFSIDGSLAGLVVKRGGLAIVPGETVIAMAERLASHGQGQQDHPGYVGVHVQPLTKEIAAATGARLGVVVTWVDPTGPAAGRLVATDVIEELNEQPVTTEEYWKALATRIASGESIRLKVRRHGDLLEMSLAAVDLPAPSGNRPLGLALRSISRVGAEVIRVDPESAAFHAGLAAGDVITLIGGVNAPTAAQVTRAFSAAPDDQPLLATITRGGTHHVVVLTRKP